eukprot:CAMPEP_0196768798 /NCGR_PEP_ID=MMETSP1104-20130614/116_1 /TAXON_ID=33652 /ORGANISM="Cafeteria sp., Strain Caron Lab Isolate" /LENGTH=177 /DNA_ID=CAMNT_0042138871 /DNA_START=73 /DNA_END=606 /DNA_ORIENTATION=+
MLVYETIELPEVVPEGREVASDAFRIRMSHDGAVIGFGAKSVWWDYDEDRAVAEDERDPENNVQYVLDVVGSNKLVEVASPVKPSDIKTHVQPYVLKLRKHLKKTNPDRVAAFKDSVQSFLTETVLADRKSFSIFNAQTDGEPNKFPIFVCWSPSGEWEGTEAVVFMLRDGLNEIKC